MNELLNKYKDKLLDFWQGTNKGQKIKLILIVGFVVASLVLFTVLATRTKYELTYVNLDSKTAGNIVQKLDEMGINYQLSAGGSNISVPEAESSKVKVTLAQEDLGGGSIYNKLWDSSSFGRTDSELRILERGAIEDELRSLVSGIEGISDANVMITLPQEKVFYAEDKQQATASIIVNIEPGYDLNAGQINSIYNLISKSVPSLPLENITLSDQYGKAFDYIKKGDNNFDYMTYNQQRQIQQEFQRDIKKELDNMLIKLMGPNKVTVNVVAKMNFDQVKTIANIKEPVVDGKGIARSVYQIQESFSGGANPNGGISGTGDSQIPGYTSSSDSNGEYQHMEETINYDVNEITKEIVSSPYKLENLSVIVAVDMPESDDPNSDTAKTQQAIRDLIKPIVMAALDEEETNVEQNIAVIAHEFEDAPSIFDNNSSNGIDPMLLFGAIGLSVLALGGFGFGMVKRRKKERTAMDELSAKSKEPEFDFSPELTEEAALLNEIKKVSNQKTGEFVQLLRTWISED